MRHRRRTLISQKMRNREIGRGAERGGRLPARAAPGARSARRPMAQGGEHRTQGLSPCSKTDKKQLGRLASCPEQQPLEGERLGDVAGDEDVGLGILRRRVAINDNKCVALEIPGKPRRGIHHE